MSCPLPSTAQHIFAQHIPAYFTDWNKDWPVSIRGGCYQNEYRETLRDSDVSTVWFSDVSRVQFIVRVLTPSHDSIPLSGSVFHYSLDVVSSAVLDQHACSCLVQCKAFKACAAQGRLGCSIIHTRRPSLPPPKKSICVRFSLS